MILTSFLIFEIKFDNYAGVLRKEEISEMLSSDDEKEESHYVLPPAGEQDSEDRGPGADGDGEVERYDHVHVGEHVEEDPVVTFQDHTEALQCNESPLLT